ncbi:MAG: heparan-alpha-glucosaminide N-acetyltransferase domain-containing protein [Planctomycetota bacterium]
MPEARPDSPPAETAARPTRLRSLDAMRGLVIAAMLLVNMTWDRDSLPAQLFHVPWNTPAQGATFTDLVFPWFIFIAGAAAPLSLRSGRGRGMTGRRIVSAAAVRAFKLYLLGVLLTVASFATERPLVWSDLLSWNILQLLGAAYFFVVLAQLAPPRWRVAIIVGLLAAKWATFLLPYETVASLATLRPAEGAPTGPGTWAHFDGVKQLLHMEHVPLPTFASLVVGWFGMAQQYLPLATIGMVGALATERIERGRDTRSAMTIAAWGVALVVVGALLQWGYDPAGGGLWGVATVPYSKWLFSPAYCLLAAGTGALLLAAMFAAVDVAGLTGFGLLQSLGKNALAVYVGAELSFKLIVSRWLLPLPDGAADSIAGAIQAWIRYATGSAVAASLGWALLWVAVWMLVAVRLDRRGLYWRV